MACKHSVILSMFLGAFLNRDAFPDQNNTSVQATKQSFISLVTGSKDTFWFELLAQLIQLVELLISSSLVEGMQRAPRVPDLNLLEW